MNTLMSDQDFADIRHLLPDSIIAMMTVAGAEAVLHLVRRFGGTHLPVGKNQTRAGKALHAMLAEEVGEHAALKLGTAYAAQRILWIPKCDDAVRELRDRFIRRRFDELTAHGDNQMTAYAAVQKLAREHSLTARWVWEILKTPDRVPPDAAQNSLF